jgi:DNA ligase-1
MFFPPMLLQYAAENKPFDDPNYIVNLKLDGIRLLVSNMDTLKLYTKNIDVTARFPELYSPPFGKGTIIDTELIVTDENGHPDWEACMSRFHSKKANHKINVCAFDILYYRGVSVMELPLEQRLILLDEALEETEYYSRMRVLNGSAVELFDIIKAAGLEGLILKKKNSRYSIPYSNNNMFRPGNIKGVRSKSWLKVINYEISDGNIFITGYSKKDHKWLIGALYGNIIKPLGTLEFGITAQHRKSVWPRLERSMIGENKEFIFVEPLITCRVKYRGYYKSGLMRLPVLMNITN